MITINIPKDIQDKILDLTRTLHDVNNSTFYSTNIEDALTQWENGIGEWIYSNITDTEDEITVLQIDKDIFIEFIDHFNRDVTINYYEKYKIED